MYLQRKWCNQKLNPIKQTKKRVLKIHSIRLYITPKKSVGDIRAYRGRWLVEGIYKYKKEKLRYISMEIKFIIRKVASY